ncbi:MAG TPA: hypothetical protein VLB06_06365 [Sulfuricaulis sp.]|nr:hypothetical protein [Sulfuricaulis sp.]
MRSHHWVTLTLYIVAVPAVFADEPTSKPSFALNAGVESFHWKEFNGDQRLLSETGPRLTVGFMLDHLLQGDQTNPYSVEARAYLGVIDYDGQTQTGVSAQTDVDYFGVNAEVMGGLRLAGSLRMDLLGGLGVDTWIRELQDGVAANGSVALGYREDYFILYGKLGPGFLFQSDTSRAYLQFGLKYPLYTYERAYLADIGFDSDVDLTPGKQLSGYAKWQMNWGRETDKTRFGVSIYYDSYRFSSSASKTVSAAGALYSVHQPASRMDVLGARLEYYY